jgi:hypothetical protein
MTLTQSFPLFRHMRPIFRTVALALVAALAAAPDVGWTQTLTAGTGVGYYWWEATNGTKGQQFLIPVEVKAQVRGSTVRVLTGYLYSYFDGEGTSSHSLDDLLDTKLNLSQQLKGPWGLDWLLGLDFNLPTGRTKLNKQDLTLIMDPDLVPITTLGEGFDANPMLMIARAWQQVTVALGAGYVFRGEYDYASDLEDYDPGDMVRVAAEAYWAPWPAWTFHLRGGYTWYGEDEVDDRDFYQAGELWSASAGVRYQRPHWSLLGELRQYWRDKDQFREPGTLRLTNEERNGYGDETQLRTVFSYDVAEATTVLLDAALLYVEQNDYSSTDRLFRGERSKLSAGIGLNQRLGAHWDLRAHVSGFTMHDEETPEHPDNERTYRGVWLDLAIQARF